MSDEPLGVTITAREIYDEIVAMRGDVRSLVEGHADTEKILNDHEERMRKLEAWRYAAAAGLFSGVGSLVTALAKVKGII